jgi:PhnB protein
LTFGRERPVVPDAPADGVMHGALTTDDFAIYGCDAQDVGDQSQIRIAIVGDDLETMTASFDALGQGGRVPMGLAVQAWGATYAEVIDQYGVAWMFNIGSAA